MSEDEEQAAWLTRLEIYKAAKKRLNALRSEADILGKAMMRIGAVLKDPHVPAHSAIKSDDLKILDHPKLDALLAAMQEEDATVKEWYQPLKDAGFLE